MRYSRRRGTILLLVLAALVLLFGSSLTEFGVDWFWFGELGHRQVFWTLFLTRLLLGLFFGLSLTVLTYLNLAIARRATPQYIPRPGALEWQQTVGVIAREGLTAILLIGSLILGGIGGLVAAGRWDDWIRFRHPQVFGLTDPVFKKDLGFYLFQYPFLQFLAGWLFTILILVTLATAAVYYLDGAVAFLQQRARVAGSVHVHLSLLLGLAMLVKAWNYWLDRYALLLKPGPLLHGAGYTDLHARLPALNILMVVAVLTALGFLLNTRIRALWLPGLALGFMIVASVTVGGLYPGLVQRFVVEPNQQARERVYIRHHLEATRRAYGLDGTQVSDYTPGRPLGRSDLRAEKGTLDNIRLWDYRVLGQTYQRLQGLRNYYHVSDVDIDRYVVGGSYRQVMLAPRELVTGQLERQERRWVNERLQYTHGYGLVMSAVNEADPAGRPGWLVQNLPLETRRGLEITRPQLYYGMQEQPPVIAPSNSRELDYPTQTESVTSSYAGTGGIPLSGAGMRGLFSAYLGDWNIFISDQVRPDSRILIRRKVQERVARLAPFLTYDHDPYLVIMEGRLVWVQDAYTAADSYPYSEPTLYEETPMLSAGSAGLEEGRIGSFNYLRNSVKATIDAYTGEVTLYAVDESDPVLRCYRQAFPGLFRSASEMSGSLRAHLRFPEDQFALQAHKLLRFHVTNPDVFYARSDVWEIPVERLHERQEEVNAMMEPYYVVMRLPGEQKEEFALILPFRTRAGTTMSAWLSGGCDGANYGRLRLFRFPTTSQVDAPEQVDNAIITDREVSKETTLLGQVGSAVRYGNLLVLPVGKSLLYVKPLYLEGTQQAQPGQGGIPELKQVILAEKRGQDLRVVMRPTLRAALAELVGAAAPEEAAAAPPRPETAPPRKPGAPAAPAGIAGPVGEARSAFDAAERAQRAGNWAEYGRQMERARAAIRRLGEAVGAAGR